MTIAVDLGRKATKPTNNLNEVGKCGGSKGRYFKLSLSIFRNQLKMSRDMRFQTMWYVRPAKAQTLVGQRGGILN